MRPTRGGDVIRLMKLGQKWHTKCRLDLFPAFCMGLREMHLIVNIVYDRSCEISRLNAYVCMGGMVLEAAELGYGEYTTHILFQDQVAKTCSGNNHALMRFHNSIKDTLGPNGIIVPCWCGVCPSAYRDKGWEMHGGDVESEGDSIYVESNFKL